MISNDTESIIAITWENQYSTVYIRNINDAPSKNTSIKHGNSIQNSLIAGSELDPLKTWMVENKNNDNNSSNSALWLLLTHL